MRKSYKGETLPERVKIGKLFPDDYPRIPKNIHPCLLVTDCNVASHSKRMVGIEVIFR